MRDLAVLLLHLLATVARLAGPGGARAVVAESVLVKHQLLILNRSRHRSPNLRLADRIVAGVCALLMRPDRLIRSAIVLKPSTLLNLHRALIRRKSRRSRNRVCWSATVSGLHAIASAKVALDVCGPEIIRVRSLDRHDAGMLVVSTPPAFLDQPPARQGDIQDRRQHQAVEW